MPRYLTSTVQTALAAKGTRIVFLVVLRQAVPGISRTVRWSSMTDGSNVRQFAISGDTYDARVAQVPELRLALLGEGGVSALDNGTIVIATPDEDGDLWTTDWDTTGPLDGAEVEFGMLIGRSGLSSADIVTLGQGIVRTPGATVSAVRLPWIDAAARDAADWPTEKFDPADYPFAPTSRWNEVKPVVLGDMTGKAFDTTGTGSAVWPHVPAPLYDGMGQKYFLRDIATASDQEEIVWLGGVPCTIPSGSRTLSGEYIQITGNTLHAWIRPHRTGASTTSVDDASYARTDDTTQGAKVNEAGALYLNFPGAPAALGALGAATSLAASDVKIHVLHKDVTAGESDPGKLTIRLAGAPLTGHEDIALDSATPAWHTESIGDHLTDGAWDELYQLDVKIHENDSQDGCWVYRVLMEVVFRSNEALAAFEEQEVLRSQLGFTESAVVASDDYMDGGYIDPPGTVRRSTPLSSPADIVEAQIRNKNWGLSRRAARFSATPYLQYEDPGSALTQCIGDDTTFGVSDGTDYAAGDAILVDAEAMRVLSIATNDLTVERAISGSRMTSHANGTDIYICPENGEIDCASFRGARKALMYADGTELVTNGSMEGTYTAGVAASWTKYDPDSKGDWASGNQSGYTARYSQSLLRSATGGSNPAVYQTLTTTAGQYYRLRFRAKAASAVGAAIRFRNSTNNADFDMTLGTGWQTYEFVLLAWASTTDVYLYAPGTTARVYYDDVSVQKLVEWEWATVVDRPVNARNWYNDALPHAKMRLIRDADGRATARVHDRARPSRETWDGSVLIHSVRSSGSGGWRAVDPIELRRTSDADMRTGVTVRYAYDRHRRVYLGSTWVGAKKEATGQTVVSFGSNILTVVDSSDVYPATGWESRKDQRMATSGTDEKTLTFTDGLGGLNVPAFQTSGVAAGAWAFIWRPVEELWLLTKVESINSETSITVADPVWEQAAGDVTNMLLSVFPALFIVGGLVFLPMVHDGPGTEQSTQIDVVGAGIHDPLHLGSATSLEPVVGDPVYRLMSYSNDGAGTADQGRLLDADRERWAMQRLATTGQVRDEVIESQLIRDRETAVALRDHVFDRRGFCWEGVARTSLAQLGSAVGDVVTLEDGLLPAGTLEVELVAQAIRFESGMIEWRWREVKRGV